MRSDCLLIAIGNDSVSIINAGFVGTNEYEPDNILMTDYPLVGLKKIFPSLFGVKDKPLNAPSRIASSSPLRDMDWEEKYYYDPLKSKLTDKRVKIMYGDLMLNRNLISKEKSMALKSLDTPVYQHLRRENQQLKFMMELLMSELMNYDPHFAQKIALKDAKFVQEFKKSSLSTFDYVRSMGGQS